MIFHPKCRFYEIVVHSELDGRKQADDLQEIAFEKREKAQLISFFLLAFFTNQSSNAKSGIDDEVFKIASTSRKKLTETLMVLIQPVVMPKKKIMNFAKIYLYVQFHFMSPIKNGMHAAKLM